MSLIWRIQDTEVDYGTITNAETAVFVQCCYIKDKNKVVDWFWIESFPVDFGRKKLAHTFEFVFAPFFRLYGSKQPSPYDP